MVGQRLQESSDKSSLFKKKKVITRLPDKENYIRY